MRYYNVTATKDGEPYPFAAQYMSEWSLKTMRAVFAPDGVELHPTHIFSIPDKPIYRRNEEGRIVPNDIAAADY